MLTLNEFLTEAYGNDSEAHTSCLQRLKTLIEFNKTPSNDKNPLHFFSSSGRVEVIGNHTDHQNGSVIAASISKDILAAVQKQVNPEIEIYDYMYKQTLRVSLNQLDPQPDDKGSSTGLIRGILAGFKKRGFRIGGFRGAIISDVAPGSGLSSSAAFENLISVILNGLYNEHRLTPLEMAKIGQFSENQYMGKPCGLMDQIASGNGGAVRIKFHSDRDPEISNIPLAPENFGYVFTITDTGGDHKHLTDYYASIPMEMKSISGVFNKNYLSELPLEDFITKIPEIRQQTGDRAVLRALHFYMETTRVEFAEKALLDFNFEAFLNLLEDSGHSSLQFLQNGWVDKQPEKQGIPLSVALSHLFFSSVKEKSVCRLNGGGFAGTILSFIPSSVLESYRFFIENVFGQGSVYPLFIRKIPVCEFTISNYVDIINQPAQEAL